MPTTLLRRRPATLAAACALALAGPPAAAATATATATASPTLLFAPATLDVPLGGTIELDIVLADRPADTPVGFFDIDVVFDPAVLSFSGLSLGDALGDLGLGEAVDASLPPDLAGGVVNLAVLSLLEALPAQPLSPVFGRIGFTAIGLGEGGLGFGFAAVESLGGVPLAFAAVDATVSVVPEPAAAWLLGTGALALFAAAARRRA